MAACKHRARRLHFAARSDQESPAGPLSAADRRTASLTGRNLMLANELRYCSQDAHGLFAHLQHADGTGATEF